MQGKDVYLTTEKIRKKFKNKFDLVNYAIKLAHADLGVKPFVLSELLERITLEEVHG